MKNIYKHYINDLYKSKPCQKMKNFIQHKNINCLKHCLTVSYLSFKLANKINRIFKTNLDCKAIARGALLHDLFLYDWHIQGRRNKGNYNLFALHGFVHPQKALDNAHKYFYLTSKEEDIIRNHMFPLTLFHMPKCAESWIVSIVDKYIAIKELIR